jgi:hypothetical protein
VHTPLLLWIARPFKKKPKGFCRSICWRYGLFLDICLKYIYIWRTNSC